MNIGLKRVSKFSLWLFNALDINYKFHTDEIVDTTFSGSTCVSCIYTPEKIITANVGDSRAVIGRCVNGGKL